MKHIIVICLAMFGCATDATDAQPADDPTELAVRQGDRDTPPPAAFELPEANTGGVPGTGCTIKSVLVSAGFGTWKGDGGVSCGVPRHEQVQTCVEWLVTGGWQTVWCQNYNAYNNWSEAWVTFSPRYYSPRWYRTRTWVSADGHVAALYSDGHYLGGVSE